MKKQLSNFQLHDTHGFDLCMQLYSLQEKNISHFPWHEFFRDATSAGWPYERILSVIKQAVSDSFWPQTLDEIQKQAFWTAVEKLESKNKV